MTNEFTTWWRKPIPRIKQVSLYNAPHPPYSPAHLSALSVASWKLQQGTCKSDSLDPANICLHRWPPWFRKCSQLNWATKSQQRFALPHTLQNQVLHAPKTLLETSLITPRAPNKPGAASSALYFSPCSAAHVALHTISGYSEPQQSTIICSKLSWNGSKSLHTQGCCHLEAQLKARNTNTDWSASTGRATCTGQQKPRDSPH